jgi:hypothetical protein
MKKYHLSAFTALLVLLLALSSVAAIGVSADHLYVPETAQLQTQPIEVSFEDLGMSGPQSLTGPVSQHSIFFNFPAGWEPVSESLELTLEFTAYFSSLMPAEDEETITGLTGGDLSVSLNGTTILLATLQDSGPQTLTAEFDPALLQPLSRNSANELVLRWDGSAACSMNLLSSVTVLPGSLISFEYLESQPDFSLNDFPVPFVVRNSIEPGDLVFLVLEDASPGEIRAALTASAGFGRLSEGQQNIRMQTLEDYRAPSDGEETLLVFLESTKLDRSSVRSLGFTGALTTAEGEGTIQMFTAVTGSTALLVTGDGEGIVKAAQLLSTGQVAAAGNLFRMTVNEINPVQPDPGRENLTLQDLGAGELNFSPQTGFIQSFDFHVPVGEQARPDSAINMVLSHSQQLDYLRSGLTVSLNDYPVASIRLSDQTSNEAFFQLILPATVIRPGRNTVAFSSTLEIRDICGEKLEETTWMRVSAGSVLHLPLERAVSGALSPKYFGDFPGIFLSSGDLSDVLIVLAEDPGAWFAANDLAFMLGSALPGQQPVQLGVAFAAYEEEQSEVSHVILVGKPSDFTGLTAEDQFPALVFNEENVLSERSSLGVVVSPAGSADVGYAAIRGYPGESHRSLLALLGNTPGGIAHAWSSLTSQQTSNHNFAIAVSEGVQASWYDGAIARGRIGAQEAVETPQLVEVSDAALQFRQGMAGWAVPVLVLLLVAIVILAVYELRRSRQED